MHPLTLLALVSLTTVVLASAPHTSFAAVGRVRPRSAKTLAEARAVAATMRTRHFAALASGAVDARVAELTADWTESDFVAYGDTQLDALHDFYSATNGVG